MISRNFAHTLEVAVQLLAKSNLVTDFAAKMLRERNGITPGFCSAALYSVDSSCSSGQSSLVAFQVLSGLYRSMVSKTFRVSGPRSFS